jgi:hypothetical protein
MPTKYDSDKCEVVEYLQVGYLPYRYTPIFRRQLVPNSSTCLVHLLFTYIRKLVAQKRLFWMWCMSAKGRVWPGLLVCLVCFCCGTKGKKLLLQRIAWSGCAFTVMVISVSRVDPLTAQTIWRQLSSMLLDCSDLRGGPPQIMA